MDSEQAKLFVGGISRETSEENLKDHFGSYGTVLGSVITKDRITNIPRGFGFVWFSDPSSADKALEDAHVILGRTVDVKKAFPRGHHQQSKWLSRSSSSSFENGNNSQFRTRKIFVGGLSASLTDEGFKNYFEGFGRITDVVMMYDNETHRPRGFGFITFESEESVENVMQKSFHELDGRFVEVKKAVPKEERNRHKNGYSYTSYSPQNYPPFAYSPTPSYGVLPNPASYRGVGGVMYGTGAAYGGWYPPGAFGGVPYGIAPMAPRGWMFPYGSSVYPSYMSGGGGLPAAGYSGILGPPAVGGKLNPVIHGNGHASASVKPSQDQGEKAEAESGSNSAASNKSSNGSS